MLGLHLRSYLSLDFTRKSLWRVGLVYRLVKRNDYGYGITRGSMDCSFYSAVSKFPVAQMALHIGNLSSHVRVDELERVFRRFGRCTVQVKEKYGFVFYDYPASAEKALKTLKGMRVCGEAITLSWAKMQPRAPPRPSRRGKLYKPPSRGNYSLKEKPHGNVASINPWDHGMDLKKFRRLGSSIMVDGPISHQPYRSNLYERGSDQTHPNDRKHVEGGRWGEQVVGPTNGKDVDNGLEFDRYEPHDSDSRRELDERECISPLAHSPSVRMSREKKGKSHDWMSEKDSPGRPDPSKGFRDKKRNWRGYDSRDVNYPEGEKGPSSSAIHSDHNSFRSQSTSRPLSRALSRSPSPSRSKSVSSKNVSQYSSPRSSPSWHSGTKTSKSQSTLRSISPSSSERKKDFKTSVANAVSPGHSEDLSEEEAGAFGAENIASAVEGEFETGLTKLEEENMTKGLSEDGEFVSRGSHDLLESDVPKSVGDVRNIDNLSLHGVEEINDSQNEDFVGKDMLARESDVVSVRSDARSRARMSSEEMCMVLGHYGLQYPDEKEKDLSVETYFGSARLWPWEMIFYRRLKRGLISTENYSRRLAQNDEFGIVDKYIRSSSGWGELN
ncbi:splicing factor [Striga asiatica]|uniref:Splicing factor n=1 Tax=Striga asiatica TaxID=4170 RepID=A0A5A7PLK8_STRAF|nr:splicing factor [Striga asiatica]